MLASVNGVFRLSQDVELRNTQGGSAIASLSLVNSEKYKTQSTGEQKENVCFVNATAFGRTGEVCSQYLRKGSKIYVSGKLKFEQWTAQDGSKRSRHVIHIDSMEMLDQKQDGAQQHNNTDDPQRHNVAGAMNRPSRDQQAVQKPIHTPPVPEIEIDSDKIPF